jgi:hypothetical protein
VRESASKDIGRQIGMALPAKRAFGDDPCVRHRQHWGRNVFAAALAAKSVVAEAGFRQIPH